MQNGITLLNNLEEPGRPGHVIDYMVLLVLLAVGLYMLVFLSNTRIMKLEACLILVLEYSLWGIIHHAMEETLTWHVLLEFLSFAALLFTILAVLFLMA